MFGMVSLETNCDAEDFREALRELEQLRLQHERQRQLRKRLCRALLEHTVKSLIVPLSLSSDEMNKSCLSTTFIYT